MPAGAMLVEDREASRRFSDLLVNRVFPVLREQMPLETAQYWLQRPQQAVDAVFRALAPRAAYPTLLDEEVVLAPGTFLDAVA